MTLPRRLIKSVASSVGVQVTRSASAGRFVATDACLSRMRANGFEPRVVIDGGANTGQFYRVARPIFPEARFHLIEPQPACREALSRLVAARPASTVLHPVAITAPGVSSVPMTGEGSTGAYVTKSEEPFDREIEATTLDALFGPGLREADRCLLKLDIESHELSALSGAEKILERVEAVLLEVSFFDVNDWGRPVFADVMAFMTRARFELYDVASLASRPRDGRLRLGDAVFVRKATPLLEDRSWE